MTAEPQPGSLAYTRVGRRAAAVLTVGVSAQFAHGAILQGLPSIALLMRSSYHLRLDQLGIILSAAGIGNLLTLLLWGMVGDRVGERATLTAGLVGAAVALVVASITTNYYALLSALIGAGVCIAAVPSGTSAALSKTIAVSKLGSAFGLRQMAAPLGGACASLILPGTAPNLGVRSAFEALAVVCLAMSAVSALLLRADSNDIPAIAPLDSHVHSFLDSGILRIAGAGFLIIVVQSCIINFTTLFLGDTFAWSIKGAAQLLAAIQISGAVGRLIVGVLSDHMPSRGTLLRQITLLTGCCLGAAAGLTVVGASVFLVPFFIAGVLAISCSSLPSAVAGVLLQPRRAAAGYGVVNTAMFAGSAAGPPVFAAVVGYESWPFAWILLSLTSLATLFLLAQKSSVTADS